MRCVKEEGKERCWFAVMEDGSPARQQRKPYTECFYAMAMAELHRATGNQKYQVRRSPILVVSLHPWAACVCELSDRVQDQWSLFPEHTGVEKEHFRLWFIDLASCESVLHFPAGSCRDNGLTAGPLDPRGRQRPRGAQIARGSPFPRAGKANDAHERVDGVLW